MRIAGLASGMDIDKMVKDLMRAERMPLDKLKQKKQTLEWQRDDYRTLNTKLLSFRDKLANLKLTPNYRARTVTSSNDTFVSATVTSGASQASYSISEVKQLASAAIKVTKNKVSSDTNKIDSTRSLVSQQGAFANNIVWQQGVVETKTFNIKEAGQEVKLDLFGGNIKPGANIKVNGKTLEVVSSANPSAGQVSIGNDGTLTFGTPLTKDSVVKVDYVLDKKTQNIDVADDVPLNVINLGRPVNKEDLEVNITLDDGITTFNLVIGDPVQNADGLFYLKDKTTGQNLGKIIPSTGAIHFNETENVFKNDEEGTPIIGVPQGSNVKISYTQNYASFDIKTQTSKGEVNEKIFINENDTLNSVIRKVNESTAGVTMFYDSFSDKVTLTRKETGKFGGESEQDIIVSGQFIENVLGFSNSDYTDGQNAIFTINGLDTQRNSNTFEMSGVTFTLKQTFLKDTVQPISISIGNDTNQVFENIKAFVTQYNELIADINGKLNENRYRSYKPLTDDEKEELSDKQQEKWEEMARSGLLKGDSVLSSVLSSMRLDMSSVIETNGLFKQLASIGIKTTANYLEGGKLEIDEAKLKEALEKDPQSVENLFRGDGSTSDRGVVHKLYDTVDATMKKLQEKAGRATSTNQQFTIGRELDNVDKGITRFEQKLKLTEDRYWRQFTAMEKAIQRANEQSNYLWQQFSGS
ncbi:flagellar filament capping protein FliD [Lederbergia wuyishanensis]|uniref:Flagellar hook-associated protein 2 n=1 Tax=Lederbergia wuyishanensis TaxID=1347903 RepID=A0ABU0D8P3_9BACI|nr:flagellar filament capping protein FliD [Lederbergia wuyishanensis]MCJ8007626.1 flagellar filament capping protein FliD [Lederbergia wuyishanensis]MDQ0344789.1 flagellar hook-associated protein 2 [Lederbergia wuyishanensis]